MFALNLTNLCTWRAINLLGEKPKFYAKIRKFLRKKNFFGAKMGRNGARWGWMRMGKVRGEVGLDVNEKGDGERWGWVLAGGDGEGD